MSAPVDIGHVSVTEQENYAATLGGGQRHLDNYAAQLVGQGVPVDCLADVVRCRPDGSLRPAVAAARRRR